MNIEKWVEDFKQGWKSKDIDSVLDLFTDDVEYYETPFEKLNDEGQIREEWKSVRDQEDIQIETEIFSRDQDKFTIKWDLSYRENGEEKRLKGIYLIKLNSQNKCCEFWQYCQLE